MIKWKKVPLLLSPSSLSPSLEKAKAIAAQEVSIKTTLELEAATKTRASLESRIKDLEGTLHSSEQANRDKDKIIDDMNDTINKLKKEIIEKDNKLGELLRRMEAEKEEVKKVVEKAIVSSVRLCVVAPTVNVHIPDKKMRFQSTLPEGQLKTFIDDQVFSKYSMLFKQETDDSSPIPGIIMIVITITIITIITIGTPVQGWIKLILQEMQTSIEKHVNNAVESAK